jgi:hypothetical protein
MKGVRDAVSNCCEHGFLDWLDEYANRGTRQVSPAGVDHMNMFAECEQVQTMYGFLSANDKSSAVQTESATRDGLAVDTTVLACPLPMRLLATAKPLLIRTGQDSDQSPARKNTDQEWVHCPTGCGFV